MNVGIIGTGYVGLVYGTVLAKLGHHVVCADVDQAKVRSLQAGRLPIHEPGLDAELIQAAGSGRLVFTADLAKMIAAAQLLMITVGTPQQQDGTPNIDAVREVAQLIGDTMDEDKIVVLKSTVPLGATRLVESIVRERLQLRGVSYRASVAMNPEFLKEGTALHDALNPSRIVIGSDDEAALSALAELYRDFADRQVPFVRTNPETAEMIKYASNAFLALKVAFINEFALLSESAGANVVDLARGMGLDPRIGPQFLQAGAGYGGSCFPKDNAAIVAIGKRHGQEMLTVQASITANERHKDQMVERIADAVGAGGDPADLTGATVAILGLSFKPGTDDVREAPSLHIIEKLLRRGAAVQAYCPHGMAQAERALDERGGRGKDGADAGRLRFASDAYDCAAGADAVVVVTEWPAFRALDLERIGRAMRGRAMLDLRNLFAGDPQARRLFDYRPIGLGGGRAASGPLAGPLESLKGLNPLNGLRNDLNGLSGLNGLTSPTVIH